MPNQELTREEMIIEHRGWLAPALRITPQAAHELLGLATAQELQAIAALRGECPQTRQQPLKTIVAAIYERQNLPPE